MSSLSICFFFFFNDTATTEIYTLSLHDALPIYWYAFTQVETQLTVDSLYNVWHPQIVQDRKSTRLNSSHSQISYAVFCLKKKKKRRYKSSSADSDGLYTGTHESAPSSSLHYYHL